MLIFGMQIIFAQSDCICYQGDKEMFKICDLYSDNVLLIGNIDSLYKRNGETENIHFFSGYTIIDSVVSTNDGGLKYYKSNRNIKFINYPGLKYVAFKDSVQLIFVDFSISKAKILANEVCFDNNLMLDDFLKVYNECDSCVQRQLEYYYNSSRKHKNKYVYKVSYFSNLTSLSRVNIYFDVKTRKLWYMELGFNHNGGIIR